MINLLNFWLHLNFSFLVSISISISIHMKWNHISEEKRLQKWTHIRPTTTQHTQQGVIGRQIQQLLHCFIPKFHYFKDFIIPNAYQTVVFKAATFFDGDDWVSKLNSRWSFCYQAATRARKMHGIMPQYFQISNFVTSSNVEA